MTIRDVAADFGYQPPNSSAVEIVSASIIGPPGTYLAPNSFDSGPYGAYLSEFSPMDTILTAGGASFFVESGAGQGMKLVVDWTTAPRGGTSIQTQLLSSNSSAMPPNSPPNQITLTMIDFGVLPISNVPVGTRQIISLPRSGLWQRYLAVQVITTGSAMTAGSFVSWLAKDVDSIVQGYASGIPIK